MNILSWTEVTINSLLGLWGQLLNFLPSLIGALIVIILGLIVSSGLRALIEKTVNVLKVDLLLKKIGLSPFFERAKIQINSGKFFGLLVYWFLAIVFFLAATDILGLFGVSMFLRDVLSYIPNIIVAVLIMLASFVLANFLKSLIRSSVSGAKLHGSKFLGSLASWTIMIFGFLAALIQLGIATTIFNTLIIGLVAMLALAGGLAFGLGGKDYATYLLEKLRRETEEK